MPPRFKPLYAPPANLTTPLADLTFAPGVGHVVDLIGLVRDQAQTLYEGRRVSVVTYSTTLTSPPREQDNGFLGPTKVWAAIVASSDPKSNQAFDSSSVCGRRGIAGTDGAENGDVGKVLLASKGESSIVEALVALYGLTMVELGGKFAGAVAAKEVVVGGEVVVAEERVGGEVSESNDGAEEMGDGKGECENGAHVAVKDTMAGLRKEHGEKVKDDGGVNGGIQELPLPPPPVATRSSSKASTLRIRVHEALDREEWMG